MRALLIATFLVATNTAYARIDFQVVHGGAPLPGAEVCFFPTPARPTGLPDALFQSGDVTCLPADQLLELPAGAWFYFIRHRAGFISDYRPLVSMPRDEPADNLRTVREEVVSAATVHVGRLLVTLRPGERLVVLSESQRAGTLILPLVAGETSFLVPANETFVVAVIADHRPVRLSEPMKLDAGGSLTVDDLPPPAANVHDVLAWIAFPQLLEEHYASQLRRLAPPETHLITAQQTFPSIFKINSVAIAETLLVFKNVPRSSARVRLTGDLWVRDEVSSLSSAAVEMIEEPLTTEPAAAIRTTVALPSVPNRSCRKEAQAPTVALLLCTSVPCTTVRADPVPEDRVVTFGGLRSGAYAVEFDPVVAGAKSRREVQTEVGVVADVRIEPDYFPIYGDVLLGDQPVARMLDFWRRGTTVSDAIDGRYAVTLSEGPPDESLRLVRVVNCDDERDIYFHLATTAPKAGERFDIVIPENSIAVELHASGTNAGLTGLVRLVAYENETHEAARFTRTERTSATGEATLAHVTTDASLAICGESEGYESRCTSRFHMGPTQTKMIELSLEPKSGFHGHLDAPVPIEYGRLWWIGDGGAITERVDVQPNGDFQFQRNHTAPESLVVASGSLPLALISFPSTQPGPRLDLTYPIARRHDLLVHLDAGFEGLAMLGLIIGRVPIPTEAFAYHQQFHGAQFVVDPSGSLRIHDVQESAPITVILGPDSPDALAQLPPGADWMSIPAFVLSRPRLTVGPSHEVAFRHR